MPRRPLYTEPNIRATASQTHFYVTASGELLDWLVEKQGMEKEPPAEIGRHRAVLRAEGMELVLDDAAMGGLRISCLGRNKLQLAEWILDFSRKWEANEI